jgi:predicted transcriptional regulator
MSRWRSAFLLCFRYKFSLSLSLISQESPTLYPSQAVINNSLYPPLTTQTNPLLSSTIPSKPCPTSLENSVSCISSHTSPTTFIPQAPTNTQPTEGPLTFAPLSGSAAYTTRVAIRNVAPDRIRANRQAQTQQLSVQASASTQASASLQALRDYQRALDKFQDAEKDGKKAPPELYRKLDEATQRIDDIIAKIEAKIEAKDREIERLKVHIAALKVQEWKREWMRRMGGLIRWNVGVVSLGHVERLVSVFR